MTPAVLNLTLNRGIVFGPLVFLFSSESIPGVIANPTSDLFTLPNHGLDFNSRVRFRSPDGELPGGVFPAITYFVIASGLTPDTFMVSTISGGSPIDVVDAGSGTNELLKPADLTFWNVYSEVRRHPEATLVLDLLPVITDPLIGEVTIPAIQDEQTILLPADDGSNIKCKWDIIFELSTGERIGPFIKGSFLIKSIITEPA